MHPNGREILQGVQSTLATYVLPEVQSGYARTEIMLVQALLGIVANEWDGAAQRLVDENAAMRMLAARGAEALREVDTALAEELRMLATGSDASVRISDLSTAHEKLREAIGRAAVVIENSDSPALEALRGDVIQLLRADAKSRAIPLMGPRADG